jgi:hypothetical protein
MRNPDLVQPPRVGAGVLAGVTVWRLAVAAVAFTGVVTGAVMIGDPWPSLSQQASVLAGVVYLGLAVYPLFTGGRALEPRSPWLRGAVCVTLLLVAVTYATLLGGDLDRVHSLFSHLLTPLVVLFDFLVVGGNQAEVRWWYPLTWLAFPAAYLAYFLLADLDLYRGFLDPHDSGFLGVVATFLVALVAAGYVLCGAAKVKAAAAAYSAADDGQERGP